MTPDFIYALVLGLVLAVLIGVTLARMSTVRSRDDFLVAGRKLPWTVLVFTLLSSWIGAGSLFAGAENGYEHGFVALWQPAGGWVGLILIAAIAGRARRFAQFTVPDLLEARYNTAARVMATIAIVISYTVITSYQFKGGGDVLHLIFPQLGRAAGMYIIAAFVILFTAAAGMASVAYLDLVIGALVTLIAVVSVPLLLRQGGWPQVRAALPEATSPYWATSACGGLSASCFRRRCCWSAIRACIRNFFRHDRKKTRATPFSGGSPARCCSKRC